nr:FAD-dependent oxidoreductase [uncultured Halomonas sp.]
MTRRVTIIGAGVTGLTSALALFEAGCEVRIIDPEPPGSGTSAANGGQLSWAFVAPLAEPGVLPKLPGWLAHADSPIRWIPRLDPALPAWGLAFLLACARHRAHDTTAALLELAALGKPQLDDWRTRLALDFDWRANGKLVVYRDAKALQGAKKQAAFQRELGVVQEVLDRDALLEREPGLEPHRDSLAGAVWTPDEEVGDCAKFCRGVASHLESQGVSIDKRRIARLEGDASQLTAWHFADGERQPRAANELLIVAAGLASRALLAPLGVRLPLYPLKGYSLTVNLDANERPFETSVTDAERKIVYAGMKGATQDGSNNRLRIAGIADLDGWQANPRASRVALLKRQASEFLPELAPRIQAAEAWTGLRPATPNGRPRLGPTGIVGLWVNAGQGALGWTLAPGSALAIARALTRRDTQALDKFRLSATG